MQLADLEECESAEEFLLEPWVLLQLPFEPTILHQWTVALMAEAMRFRMKIVDFTTMAYPEHLKSVVDKLVAIATLLLEGAHFFMKCISDLIIKAGSFNHLHATATLHWKEFQTTLPRVLPALKFVLSDECDTVIAALKCNAWSENAVGTMCKSKVDTEYTLSIYCYEYWESINLLPWLFDETRSFNVDCPDETLIQGCHCHHQQHAAHMVANNVDPHMMEVIDKEIIKPGRLQGESKEIIFQAAAKDHISLKVFYYRYEQFKGKCKF
jgi:hypothetical protein